VTDPQPEEPALKARLDQLGWGVACKGATLYLVAVVLRLVPRPPVGLNSELGLLGALIGGPSLVLYVLAKRKLSCPLLDGKTNALTSAVSLGVALLMVAVLLLTIDLVTTVGSLRY